MYGRVCARTRVYVYMYGEKKKKGGKQTNISKDIYPMKCLSLSVHKASFMRFGRANLIEWTPVWDPRGFMAYSFNGVEVFCGRCCGHEACNKSVYWRAEFLWPLLCLIKAFSKIYCCKCIILYVCLRLSESICGEGDSVVTLSFYACVFVYLQVSSLLVCHNYTHT